MNRGFGAPNRALFDLGIREVEVPFGSPAVYAPFVRNWGFCRGGDFWSGGGGGGGGGRG